jgi:hypothetical protein
MTPNLTTTAPELHIQQKNLTMKLVKKFKNGLLNSFPLSLVHGMAYMDSSLMQVNLDDVALMFSRENSYGKSVCCSTSNL